VPDLIEPAIDVAEDGTIAVPTGPGIGVNVLRERVEKASERHLVVDAREVAR
jgi:L-alanine-DL-glutamate epimerase-like enolase superfamily enzyme